MEIITSVVCQAILVAIAFAVTLMRCWIRVFLEHRKLTHIDWLVWGGFFCTLGWFICSTRALFILVDHPLDEETRSDSVDYLKTVFASIYFFDTGLYFPKASLVSFYWWLIPAGFRRLRIAIYITTAIVASCFVASILSDTLIAPKISDNWSIENQLSSAWNTFADLVVNWVLNFVTDLLLFILPFFVVNCLKLRKRQKLGLVGIFSLGAITMAISLARFIVYAQDYDVSDADGRPLDLWCTAEMCTAVIVVSLPFFKSLIMRSSPSNTNRSNTGYISGPSHRIDPSGLETYTSHVRGGPSEDELELTFQDRKGSPTPTGTTDEGRTQDGKDNVIVTTNVTVTRDML
ncbi:hypothetical protein yc1106_01968 [Curvularia clavata]|uniref:Rhodopsin domain-containing protein n=1 Tax=Curvularia clavata TaxID=95742 RepID=A0A9Q9DQH4_CURCL|nr:hypothetical protein yc1106_01968 [Curvularia clavata]